MTRADSIVTSEDLIRWAMVRDFISQAWRFSVRAERGEITEVVVQARPTVPDVIDITLRIP